MSLDIFYTSCCLLLLSQYARTVYSHQQPPDTLSLHAAMNNSDNYLCEPVASPQSDLGEGPHWNDAKSTLYYVDAFVGDIHRYQVKENKHSKVNLGDLVTIVIPIENSDQLLVSIRNKVVRLNWDNATYSVVAEVASERNGKERFNDAKIDALGRLWIGTLLNADDGSVVPGAGSLYKLENDHFVKMSDNFTLSNGMAWNHNNTVMYFNDSEDRKTYAFDFDLANGTLSNKRILVDYSTQTATYGPGEYPDGMAMDADGLLWIALYGGARIIQLDPHTGKLLTSVKVPAPQTTSLAFGGANFSEIYVTTGNGSVKGNAELQRQYPNAGKIFKVTRKANMAPLVGVKAFNYGQ